MAVGEQFVEIGPEERDEILKGYHDLARSVPLSDKSGTSFPSHVSRSDRMQPIELGIVNEGLGINFRLLVGAGSVACRFVRPPIPLEATRGVASIVEGFGRDSGGELQHQIAHLHNDGSEKVVAVVPGDLLTPLHLAERALNLTGAVRIY